MKGSTGVKGRLKQCLSYLESTIGVSRFILDIISEGIKLPFVIFPDSCYIRNNRSAGIHSQFVEDAVSKLLLSDCIQEHSEPPFLYQPVVRR